MELNSRVELFDRGIQGPEPVVAIETDKSLAARAGTDSAAMTELYRRYVHRIDRYCRRQLQSADLAEDVTSLVFLKALESLRRNRVDNVASWLFTIAHNEIVSLLRRQRSVVDLEQAEGMASLDRSPEDTAIAWGESRELQECLQTLTNDQRRLIELRLAGLTSSEIREVLGKSRTWVSTTQFRAIHRLREMMVADTHLEEH